MRVVAVQGNGCISMFVCLWYVVLLMEWRRRRMGVWRSVNEGERSSKVCMCVWVGGRKGFIHKEYAAVI